MVLVSTSFFATFTQKDVNCFVYLEGEKTELFLYVEYDNTKARVEKEETSECHVGLGETEMNISIEFRYKTIKNEGEWRNSEKLEKKVQYADNKKLKTKYEKKEYLKKLKENSHFFSQKCFSGIDNDDLIVSVKLKTNYTGINVLVTTPKVTQTTPQNSSAKKNLMSLSRELTNQAQELSVEKNELIKV